MQLRDGQAAAAMCEALVRNLVCNPSSVYHLLGIRKETQRD
jgi:hypothetical protein